MKKTQDTNVVDSTEEAISPNGTTFLASVIIGVLLINAGITWFIANSAANQVFNKYKEMEYYKVGGEQNYNDLNIMQRNQIKPYLEQQKKMNPDAFKDIVDTGSTAAVVTNTGSTSTPAATDGLTIHDITDEKLAAMKKDAPINGNKDAQILLFEYSDFDCPYCQRQYKDGTIASVVAAYGDKVASIYKPTPVVHYDTSLVKSEAAFCVRELAGDKASISFSDKVFEHGIKISDPASESASERITALVDIAVGLGVKKADVKKCIESGKYKTLVDGIVAEGQSLSEDPTRFGTPATIAVNVQTKKYVVIGGAYPLATFKSAVDKLLKE